MSVWSENLRPSCYTSEQDLNARLFAHIHLDHRLEGSHLQGATFAETTALTLKMLRYALNNPSIFEQDPPLQITLGLQKSSFTTKKMTAEILRKGIQETLETVEKQFNSLVYFEAELQNEIQALQRNTDRTYSDIVKSSLKITQSILENLRSKEIKSNESNDEESKADDKSVFFAGGWSGQPKTDKEPGLPGHGMAFHLIRKPDNSYVFIVFNSGAGIEHHIRSSQIYDKYRPVMAFKIPKTVPEESLKLFISNRLLPVIKPNLNQVKGEPLEGFQENNKYNGNRIYEDILIDIAFLGGNEINPEPYSKMNTKGQFSGTCSMRVLMPLLQSVLQKEVFQQFLLQFRIQTIIDHFRIQQKLGSLETKTIQRQLRTAIAKLARTSQKLMIRTKNGKEVLSKYYGARVLNELNNILKELNLHVKPIENKGSSEEIQELRSWPNSITVEQTQAKSEDRPREDKEKKEKEERFQSLSHHKNFNNPLEYLKACYKVLSLNAKFQYTSANIHAIETFFLNMPLDFQTAKNYWSSLKKEDAASALQYLHMIFRIYGKSCTAFQITEAQNPKQVTTTQTAMCMASFISARFFEKFPKRFFSRKLLKLSRLTELESTSLDPNWDTRLDEAEQLTDTLYKLEIEYIEKKEQYGQYEQLDNQEIDYYDDYFLKSHLDPLVITELKEFSYHTISSDENARANLYTIAKDFALKKELKVSPKVKEAISDYGVLLQFDEFSAEARAFAKGERDLFNDYRFNTDPNQDFSYLYKELSFKKAEYYHQLPRGKTLIFSHKEVRCYGHQTFLKLLDLKDPKIIQSLTQDIELEKRYQAPITSNNLIIAAVNAKATEGSDQFPKRKFSLLRRLKHEGRILQTKAFFESDYKSLNERDVQTEILLNIFAPKILNKALSRNPRFVNHLIDFLEKGFKYHIRNHIVTNGGIFLYEMSHYLYKYLQHHPSKEHFRNELLWLQKLNESLKKIIQFYRRQLRTDKINKKEAANKLSHLMAVHLMRESNMQKDKISNEDLKILLLSFITLTLNESNHEMNSLFCLESFNTRVEIYPYLESKFLQINNKEEQLKLLHEVFTELWVPNFIPDDKFKLDFDFPKVSIKHEENEFIVDFQKGKIESHTNIVSSLPSEVYTKIFIELFGDEPIQCIISKSWPQNIYSFLKFGKEYKVYQNIHSMLIKIFMKIGESDWYELYSVESNLDPKTVLPFYPGQHNLDPDKHWWRKVNEKFSNAYLCTDLNHHFLFDVSETKSEGVEQTEANKVTFQCRMLKPNGERAGMTLLPAKAEPPHPLYIFLSRFEDSKFIEIWQADELKESQNPYFIKLPRYNLEWIAYKSESGKIEYRWSKDKSFNLNISTDSFITGFPHTLTMTKQSYNKKTDKITQETILLVPQQEFYPTGKYEDEFYELNYDRGATIKVASIEKYLLTQVETKSCKDNVYYTHSEKYCLFKIKKIRQKLDNEIIMTQELQGQSSEDYLQLAYIYLAKHEPELAMKVLETCNKQGGIKGTLREIEIIRRIITEIPNAEYSNKLFSLAKTAQPNEIAVRMFAAWLLSNQKQQCSNKPKFTINENGRAKSFKNMNEEWNAARKKITANFYHHDFDGTAMDLCTQYQRQLENISIEMQLKPEQEFVVLKVANKGLIPANIPGSNRWRELMSRELIHKREQLFKILSKDQGLNASEDLELKNLQDKIVQSNLLSSLRQKIKPQNEAVNISFKKPALSPYHQEILLMVKKWKELNHDSSYGSEWMKSSWTEQKQKIEARWSSLFNCNINDLKIGLRSEQFLILFDELYDRIINKTLGKRDSEILHMFINANLAAKAVIQSDSQSNPIIDFCALLKIVIDNPDYWPKKLEFKDSKTLNETLDWLFRIAHSIIDKSPIKINIPVARASMKPKKPKFRVNLDNNDPNNTGIIPKLSLQNKGLTYALGDALTCRDLNIQEMIRQITELKQKKGMVLLEAKENKDVDEGSFISLSSVKYIKDLETGIRQNQEREIEKEFYRKYLSLPQKLKAIENALQEMVGKENKELIAIQNELLITANHALTGIKASIQTQAELIGEKISPLTLEDLFWLYLQGDAKLYQKKTRLKLDSLNYISILHCWIHDYLLRATANQQRERIIGDEGLISKLKGVKPGSPEYDNILVKIGDELIAKRCFNAEEHPEFLLFEYTDNKLLRQNQVKILEKLLFKKNGLFNNHVIQLIMGAGKSKVLLPLLALKKADGTNLSLIIVPVSLYQTNKIDLRSAVMDIFNIEGIALEFDRDTPCTSITLRLLLDKLQTAIAHRQYVITTAESLQAMQLKYLELLDDSVEDKESAERILALENILNLIKEKGDGLIDECDTVLDPNRELNYTQGTPLSVSTQILKNIQQMYRLFSLVEIKLEGEQSFTLQDVAMGKAKIMKEQVWKQAMEGLATQILESKQSPLFKNIQRLSETHKEILKLYLLNDMPKLNSKELPKPPEFLYRFGDEVLSLIGLVKGELEIFKDCLKRKPNEHYGFPVSHNFPGCKENAIPYEANNTPNERAEFGSVYEIINYTLFLQDQRALIPQYLIDKFIADYRNNAKREIVRKLGVGFKDTRAAKEFFELTGVSLSLVELFQSQEERNNLGVRFSKIQKVRDAIVLNYVLPSIKEYPFILRSNAINFASQLRSHQALSGTPWNMGCYAADFCFNDENSLGTDGKTIDTLLKKQPKILVGNNKTPEYLIQSFIVEHPDTLNIHAFIDIGALFTGLSNEKIAKLLAAKLAARPGNPIKHILYFNEHNELTALPFHLEEERKFVFESPIMIGTTDEKVIVEQIGRKEGWFTYFDQRHTMGIDIKQPCEARGIGTVDIDTLQRSLLQGSLRMREYADSQTLDFIIPKVLSDKILADKIKTEIKISSDKGSDKCNINDILEFTKNNQIQILSNLHFRSALDKIENVVRQFLLMHLMKTQYNNKRRLRKLFSEAFVTITEKNPFKKFKHCEQELSTTEILTQNIEHQMKTLKNILLEATMVLSPSDETEITTQMNRILEHAKENCLQTYRHIPSKDEGSTNIIQKLKANKKELKRDVKKEAHRRFMRQTQVTQYDKEANSKSWLERFPLNLLDNTLPVQIESLNDMIAKSYSRSFVFSNNIYVSENYKNTALQQTDPLDGYQKPISFFIVIKSSQTNKLNILIISLDELEELFNYAEKNKEDLKKQGYEIWFKNTHDDFLADDIPIEIIQSEEYQKLLTQLRFFNGDLDQLLKTPNLEWLLDDLSKKLDFLCAMVVPNNLDQAKDYENLQHELQSTKYRLMEEGSKVTFEMLYMAIESNNLNKLYDLLQSFSQQASPLVQRLILNEYPRDFVEPLLSFAIGLGNKEIVKRLLQENEILKTVFHEKSALLSAIKDEEMFKLVNDKASVFPDENDRSNWFFLLKTILETDNDAMILPFLKQMKKYCYVVNEVRKQLLLEFYKKDIKTVTTLLMRLETMEIDTGSSQATLSRFIEFILDTVRSLPEKDAYLQLIAWYNTPPFPELRTFISSQEVDKPHLLQSIYNDHLSLLKLLMEDKRFSLPSESILKYSYLLSANSIEVIKFLIHHMKTHIDNKLRAEQLSNPAFMNAFNTLIKQLSESKASACDLDINAKIMLLLEYYPSITDELAWKTILKELQSHSTFGKKNLLTLLYQLNVRSKAFALPFLIEYLPGVIDKYDETISTVVDIVKTIDLTDPALKSFGTRLLESSISGREYGLSELLFLSGFTSMDVQKLDYLAEYALDNKKYNLLGRLFAAGVSPNLRIFCRDKIIFIAIEMRDPKLLEVILAAKANFNHLYQATWNTPFMYAVLKDRELNDFSISRFLLEYFGDTAANTFDGLFSQHVEHAIKNRNFSSIEALNCLKFYDIPYSKIKDSLIKACQEDDIEMLKALLIFVDINYNRVFGYCQSEFSVDKYEVLELAEVASKHLSVGAIKLLHDLLIRRNIPLTTEIEQMIAASKDKCEQHIKVKAAADKPVVIFSMVSRDEIVRSRNPGTTIKNPGTTIDRL